MGANFAARDIDSAVIGVSALQLVLAVFTEWLDLRGSPRPACRESYVFQHELRATMQGIHQPSTAPLSTRELPLFDAAHVIGALLWRQLCVRRAAFDRRVADEDWFPA